MACFETLTALIHYIKRSDFIKVRKIQFFITEYKLLITELLTEQVSLSLSLIILHIDLVRNIGLLPDI